MLYGTITEFCTPETARPLLLSLPLHSSPIKDLSSRQKRKASDLRRSTDLSLPSADLQCQIMSAGPRFVVVSCSDPDASCYRANFSPPPVLAASYEFLFEDGSTYKKPTALSAPQYVDALMTWVQGLLDDEEVFPARIGESKPGAPPASLQTSFASLYSCLLALSSACRFRRLTPSDVRLLRRPLLRDPLSQELPSDMSDCPPKAVQNLRTHLRQPLRPDLCSRD
jgi:hypothetical protein